MQNNKTKPTNNGKAFSLQGLAAGIGAGIPVGLLGWVVVVVLLRLGKCFDSINAYLMDFTAGFVYALTPGFAAISTFVVGGYVSACYSNRYPVMQGVLVAMTFFLGAYAYIAAWHLAPRTIPPPLYVLTPDPSYVIIPFAAAYGGYLRKLSNKELTKLDASTSP